MVASKKIKTWLIAVLLGIAGGAFAQSKLPPCAQTGEKNNCFGEYTYPDGAKYVGEFNADKFNGQGTLIHVGGAKYAGQFKDGSYNGQGSFTWGNGEKYVGEFRDGEYNGRGVEYLKDGMVSRSGVWENGKFVQAQAQSRLPACSWFGVKDNCVGETTLTNGKYVGEFKDDKPNGQGTLKYRDGSQYVGEFKDGHRNGQGTHTVRNWTYVGEFKRDRYDGLGTLTSSGGGKYVGEFKDNSYYGRGIEYSADGAVLQAGIWENDKLVRPEAGQYPAVAATQPATNQTQEATRPRPENPGATKLAARALVIGNGAYTNFGRLPNPRSDAQAIAAKFRSFGIEVDLVLDADRDTLVRALNEYASKATGRDVNILFYAGHGLQIEGTNYLIPTNMRADGISAGYVKLNGISLNAVMDYMSASTRLIFLDACRDNPASRSLVATRGAGSVGLAPVSASTGTLIAYATKEGTVAADGNGTNSPYTTALLRHLDAPLDIGIVLRRVRQTVLQMTSNTQEPWEYGSLIGDQLILSQMAR